MPLIEIAALPAPGVNVDEVLRGVNRAVSDAIGCRLDAVWTTWRWIDGGYAVGDVAAAGQPEATHAPVVHVYARRTPDELERIAAAVESVVADAFGLAAGNVFVTVQPVWSSG